MSLTPLLLLVAATMATGIDSFWEYSDPAASEARFRARLEASRGDERLEILTQIARSYSLRKRYAEAHRLLDEIEPQLAAAGPRPRVRYLLERGRTFNSAGDRESARSRFLEAWEAAREVRDDGLAVDAAHMVAITWSDTAQGVEWNRRGLAMARGSTDAKARALIPAMLNNAAWDLHALGRYDEALVLFEDAQKEWIATGKPRQVEIAKWSVARCLRSLGRAEEALAILRALEAEQAARGPVDADVAGEIGRNLEMLGKAGEARPYLERAGAPR